MSDVTRRTLSLTEILSLALADLVIARTGEDNTAVRAATAYRDWYRDFFRRTQ